MIYSFIWLTWIDENAGPIDERAMESDVRADGMGFADTKFEHEEENFNNYRYRRSESDNEESGINSKDLI